jgi:hypothetical protein
MTRRAGRNHNPAFKAKLALSTIRGEQTLEVRTDFRSSDNSARRMFLWTRSRKNWGLGMRLRERPPVFPATTDRHQPDRGERGRGWPR